MNLSHRDGEVTGVNHLRLSLKLSPPWQLPVRARRGFLCLGLAGTLAAGTVAAHAQSFARLNGKWDLTSYNWRYAGGKDQSPDGYWVDGGSPSFNGLGLTQGDVGIVEVMGTRTVSSIYIGSSPGEYWFQGGEIHFENPIGAEIGMASSKDAQDQAAIVEPQFDSLLSGTVTIVRVNTSYEAARIFKLGGATPNPNLDITVKTGCIIRLQKTAGALSASHLTISGGALEIPASAGLQTLGTLTMTGGTFNTTASNPVRIGTLEGVSNFVASNGTVGLLYVGAGDYSGSVSNGAGLVKETGGTLKLKGVNGFTGITLYGGVVEVSQPSAIGGSGVLTFNGGTLRATSAVTLSRAVTVVSGTVDGPLSFSGQVSAPGGATLTKTGAGSTTVLGGGANNPALRMAVSSGILRLSKASTSLINAVGDITDIAPGASVELYGGSGGNQIYDGSGVNLSGGTLEMMGNNEVIDRLTGTGKVANSLLGTSTLTVGAGNGSSIYGGSFFEPFSLIAKVALVKTGTGQLELAGSSPYFTGGITAAGGTLYTTGNGALGTGPIQIEAGGRLAVFTPQGGAAAGAVTVKPGGKLDLYKSDTTLAGLQGDGVVVNGASTDGASTLVIPSVNGGYYGIIGGNPAVDPNSQRLGLNITPGGGFYGLYGANTYTGPTTVGGYVSLFHAQALGTTAAGTTVTETGTLELKPFATDITLAEPLTLDRGALWMNPEFGLARAILPGPVTLVAEKTGTVGTGGATTLTLTGAVNGGGSLVKAGAGTAVLNGAKTYTGGTVISGGTLLVNNTLATSQVTLGDAASGTARTQLTLDGAQTFTHPILVAATGGEATLATAAAGSAVFNGSIILLRTTTLAGGNATTPGADHDNIKTRFDGGILGDAAVNIEGPGWVQYRVTGTKEYTGATTVLPGGQLSLWNFNSLPVASVLTIQTGGLVMSEGTTQTFGGLNGGGTLTTSPFWGASTIVTGNADGNEVFSGAITGLIHFQKNGTGKQTLSGPAAYTGNTTVSQGTLSLATPFLADTSTVTLAAGATLELTHNATDRVAALIIDGVAKPPGLYGAVGSANTADTEIPSLTGTGRIRVGPETPVFDQWALSFSLTGGNASPSGDPDQDGNLNLDEFAFGGSPISGLSMPDRLGKLVDTNNDGVPDLTLTVQVRAGAVFTASGGARIATVDGITCRIEGSEDTGTFASTVAEVTPHAGIGAPRAGYVFKTFRLVPGASSSRGFLRATATVP